MRAYIGITDGQWYRFLRSLPRLEEINFWKPGGRHRFGAIAPGELFLFKLHSPHNFVVGGGVFSYSTILPMSLAWESFKEGNGAPTFDEMRRRISSYRRSAADSREDYAIGCILLSHPFFLEEADWIPVPEDWSAGIQQGKTYELDRGHGSRLFHQLEHALLRESSGTGSGLRAHDAHEDLAQRYGKPVLIEPRLGQGTFRVVVTDAYERRCAITGEKVLPVLQAAHIRPYARQGPHRVQNGILLRSDLHALFDRGYMIVTPSLQLEVSGRLHEDFDNGRDYYALHGTSVRAPRTRVAKPAEEYLQWHNENVYRG